MISEADIVLKSPTTSIPPYRLNEVIGKKAKVDLGEEAAITLDDLA
jgi:sialic acid synthase SpsE